MDPIAFEHAITAAFEAEPSGALLRIDLDGLATINAEAGRSTGDRLIRRVGRTLRALAGEEGWTLGRIAGDEFALFAAHVPLATAFLRAEQLRADLHAALARVSPKGSPLTVSIGVAAAPANATDAPELMKMADLALHAAKRRGGAMVALASGEVMVLRSSYFTTAQAARLKALAARLRRKESTLLREALDELLRKYDRS